MISGFLPLNIIEGRDSVADPRYIGGAGFMTYMDGLSFKNCVIVFIYYVPAKLYNQRQISRTMLR